MANRRRRPSPRSWSRYAAGGRRVGGPGGFSDEALILFAAMAVEPDATRKGVIDTMIRALISAGVWDLLDVLYVFAAHTEQAALLNWVAPGTLDGVKVSTPTFAADEGFTPASGAYINSGFIPSAGGTNFVLDSAHCSVRSLTAGVDSASARLLGDAAGNAGRPLIIPHAAAETIVRMNEDGGANIANAAGSAGLFTVSRTSSTVRATYRNGTLLESQNVNSVVLAGGALNIGADVETLFFPGIVASATIGAGLNGTQVAAHAAAELAYMQAVGAV